MEEREFAEYLIDLLSNSGVVAERFFNAGLMTLDEGLVVNCPDGEQFQITIKRSR